jgi:hypothetical protein
LIEIKTSSTPFLLSPLLLFLLSTSARVSSPLLPQRGRGLPPGCLPCFEARDQGTGELHEEGVFVALSFSKTEKNEEKK